MLCKLYGLGAQETDELVTLARQCRIKGWWQKYDLPEFVSAYTGLEEEASTLQQYSVDVLPDSFRPMPTSEPWPERNFGPILKKRSTGWSPFA